MADATRTELGRLAALLEEANYRWWTAEGEGTKVWPFIAERLYAHGVRLSPQPPGTPDAWVVPGRPGSEE